MKSALLTLLAAAVLVPTAGATTRIKELVTIEGVRDNQLVGYGLVVGLAGTGDRRQTVFSAQSLTNMLERMGVNVPPTAIQVANTAAVMVTATFPPFAQPGGRIDVTASAIGDAKTLQGGVLLLTPLRAADGQVYAVAQGSVITGGFVAGAGGNSQTLNHPTAGRIPEGAIVERAAPAPKWGGQVRLQLKRSDFTTAARIAAAINKKFVREGPAIATAETAGLVAVSWPSTSGAEPVLFISELERLTVDTDYPARIVISERTGTVAMGSGIRIAATTVLHAGLTVKVQTSFEVSQPNPMAAGETAVTPNVAVSAHEEKARNLNLKDGATVEDLVRAMVAIGSTPRDIIAVLETLRVAGALDADIEVI
jgi:flagellar P-ring protein FlgI